MLEPTKPPQGATRTVLENMKDLAGRLGLSLEQCADLIDFWATLTHGDVQRTAETLAAVRPKDSRTH